MERIVARSIFVNPDPLPYRQIWDGGLWPRGQATLGPAQGPVPKA